MMGDVGTLTLTEFLLARIAEDEAVAGAFPEYGLHWTDGGGYGWGAVEATDAAPHDTSTVVYDEGRPTEAQAAHIARWDPARVLAECEARRRIVEEVEGYLDANWPIEPVLRLLALPYADHPSFQEAWKP